MYSIKLVIFNILIKFDKKKENTLIIKKMLAYSTTELIFAGKTSSHAFSQLHSRFLFSNYARCAALREINIRTSNNTTN